MRKLSILRHCKKKWSVKMLNVKISGRPYKGCVFETPYIQPLAIMILRWHRRTHIYVWIRALCAYRGGGTHRPPAIFHSILLPSAHATLRARQNARRRRDARFYLSAIYLPTRALLKRGTDSRPCRGQIWKVINRSVLDKSAVALWPPPRRQTSSFHASYRLTKRRRILAMRGNVPLSIGTRGSLKRRCESMGGDKPQKEIESTLFCETEGDRLRREYIYSHAWSCKSYKSQMFKLFDKILRTPDYLSYMRICISRFINIHIVAKKISCIP